MYLINPHRFAVAAAGSGRWNPAKIDADMTITGGGATLQLPKLNGQSGSGLGLAGVNSGDRYFELILTGTGNTTQPCYGIALSTWSYTDALVGTDGGGLSAGWIAAANGGNGALYMYNFPYGTTSARPAVNDVVGIRLQYGSGNLMFYKNGVYMGQISRSEFNSNTWYPAASGQNLGTSQDFAVTLNTTASTLLYLPSGAAAWE